MRSLSAFFVLTSAIGATSWGTEVKSNRDELASITVRTFVEKPWGGFRHKDAVAHGRNYAIVALDRTAEPEKGTPPVAENEMLAYLRTVLAAQGFRDVGDREKPEILLTVLYGRGMLKNPYLEGVIYNEMTDPPTATVMEAPKQNLGQKSGIIEAKLQRANEEKLFIRITAWKAPDGSKAKPVEVWNTTVIYDNPRQDLNRVFKEMLDSGGPYFDREIDKVEVDIRRSENRGKVEVGTPEIVKPTERTPR